MVICAAAFAVLMCIALPVYGKLGRKLGYPAHIYLKMTCSSIFLIAGGTAVIWLFCADRASRSLLPAGLILGGLFFGWLGDLMLDISALKGDRYFILGIFCFALNHIAFLAALLLHTPFSPMDLAVFALVTVIGGFVGIYGLKLKIPKKFLIPGLFYYAVITLMLTEAFSFLWSGASDLFGWVFAAGALMFFTSDVVLVTNKFSGTYRKTLDTVNGICYFFGQLFCACSVFALI